MLIVQKYGGKSVATIERIKDVARQIVQRHIAGVGLVVVVSAMADTTDGLLQYAHLVSNKPRQRELDMLLTAGERISMALLSMAIWDMGHSAISFTGSQSGIITDDVHTRARIVEIRANRIINELQQGRIVIVAGFQGVSARREVTTLGRGGSDTTAVAIACAIGAERCEILSDVDGLYSADPKVHSDAIHIPKASYDMLFDMAFFGSKVIHPRAVALAKKYSIPLLLASSIKKERSTMVTSKAIEGANFTAVSSHKEIIWVMLNVSADALSSLVNELEKLRTGIRTPSIKMKNGVYELCFWILPEQKSEVEEILVSRKIDYSVRDASIVAVSGNGIAESAEAIASVVNLLNDKRIPFIYIGNTNNSIFTIVPQHHCALTEKVIHGNLVKNI